MWFYAIKEKCINKIKKENYKNHTQNRQFHLYCIFYNMESTHSFEKTTTLRSQHWILMYYCILHLIKSLIWEKQVSIPLPPLPSDKGPLLCHWLLRNYIRIPPACNIYRGFSDTPDIACKMKHMCMCIFLGGKFIAFNRFSKGLLF